MFSVLLSSTITLDIFATRRRGLGIEYPGMTIKWSSQADVLATKRGNLNPIVNRWDERNLIREFQINKEYPLGKPTEKREGNPLPPPLPI